MAISSVEIRDGVARQAVISVTLATIVLIAWLSAQIFGVFFYEWGWHSVVTAPLLVAISCWLYVGLFIIAHDCMHGSLVPFKPKWNRTIGRICLFLYVGFNYDELNRKHHLHHRYAGTADDPDFDDREPHGFVSWYLKFFSEYFTWRNVLFLAVVACLYVFFLDTTPLNPFVFWAVPAILSSLQLFYFGTYLPHRPEDAPFSDRHRSRSNNFDWIASLLTCFHFGYHHEHHQYPHLPWWRLPSARPPHSEKV
ncbi:MAG: fatty acid desaturase [Pseudomonadota bacterium]